MTATTVEAIERKLNSHLRRWLGVPPSFTAIGLYSRSSQLQLPLTSTLEEYKVSKSRLVMTLRDSKDSKISKAGIQTRTGRKWSARKNCSRSSRKYSSSQRHIEEQRRAKAVELSRQGAWMKWNLPERKTTWAELWRIEPFRISFMLRSVYDTLPSPSNLHQWGLIEEPSCRLCGERGTMAHILSGCKVGHREDIDGSTTRS
ncbi:unnamed protein product [Mytilus coruscus]|uniref:Reverse transcriptase zinc-binding domain-containing protein n=1 Tax=Mytilus coruscus TaxID=42192 RepID=A0A6J8D9X9_MYTCO|nr:unnamed protein product [Mytilus coruscus]